MAESERERESIGHWFYHDTAQVSLLIYFMHIITSPMETHFRQTFSTTWTETQRAVLITLRRAGAVIGGDLESCMQKRRPL